MSASISKLPAHEWIVYRLSLLLRSVGHRVKTHRITPADDNERYDIKIQDYVFLPHGEDDRLPPRTLVMDVTLTHDRYGRTTQYTNRVFIPRFIRSRLPTTLLDPLPLIVLARHFDHRSSSFFILLQINGL